MLELEGCMLKKWFGFTLAEVLITLAIIGIVAVLTIPQVVANYKEKAHIVRLKKISSELYNVYSLAVFEHGPVNSWSNGTTFAEHGKAINDILEKYLKYTKVCSSISQGCNSPDTYNTDGTKGQNIFDYYTGGARKYFLTNGAIIRIIAESGDNYLHNWCKNPSNYSHYLFKCGSIVVDTNGFKGPNRNGVDIFKFIIMQDKLLPLGTQQDHSQENFDRCKNASGIGSCTAWVLYNENLDYLHCPDELGWNGKHSCKD